MQLCQPQPHFSWHRKATSPFLIPPTKLWLAQLFFQPGKQPSVSTTPDVFESITPLEHIPYKWHKEHMQSKRAYIQRSHTATVKHLYCLYQHTPRNSITRHQRRCQEPSASCGDSQRAPPTTDWTEQQLCETRDDDRMDGWQTAERRQKEKGWRNTGRVNTEQKGVRER